MQQQYDDAIIVRIKASLAQLSEREIALLILNARKERLAVPLAVETSRTILELARQEIARRR